MLKALIVDDEQHCVDRLTDLLTKYDDRIELAGYCGSVTEAKHKIETTLPDIVFLDVHLHNETGFDLLSRLPAINFEIIFTTAFDTYAVQAFKFSALDYLLKPVDETELKRSVSKLIEKKDLANTSKKLEVLFHNFENKIDRAKKLAVPTLEGLLLLEVDKILRFQSDGNYTDIHTATNKTITATKTLKYFENLLGDGRFFRVHKSHMINLAYVDRYLKGKGGHLVMSDKTTIEVAVRRKEKLLKKLTGSDLI